MITPKYDDDEIKAVLSIFPTVGVEIIKKNDDIDYLELREFTPIRFIKISAKVQK